MENAINWGWVAAFIAIAWSVINSLYTWYSSAQSVTKKDVGDIMRNTVQLGDRITKIESDMRAMPTADQFHELDIKVTEVSGAIRTMEAEMRPTALSVKRIEDFLLNSNLAKQTTRR